jgi:hypothetical protein
MPKHWLGGLPSRSAIWLYAACLNVGAVDAAEPRLTSSVVIAGPAVFHDDLHELGVIRFKRNDRFWNLMLFEWRGVRRGDVKAFGDVRLDNPHVFLTFEDADAAIWANSERNVAIYPITPADKAPSRYSLAFTGGRFEWGRMNELDVGVYEFTGPKPRFFRVLDDCVIVAACRDDLLVAESSLQSTLAQFMPDTRVLLAHRVSNWSDRRRNAVAVLASEAQSNSAGAQFEAMVLEQLSQIETIGYSVSRIRDERRVRLRMTLKALPDTALARIWNQPYSAGDQTDSKLTDWLGNPRCKNSCRHRRSAQFCMRHPTAVNTWSHPLQRRRSRCRWNSTWRSLSSRAS